MEMLGGRLRPAVGFDQGASGETLASMLARVQQVIDTAAEVVIWHGSHNDFNGSYTHTTNSAWNSTWVSAADYNVKWQAILSALEAGLPNAVIVPVLTVPSNSAPNETVAVRDAIWAYQRAINQSVGGGNRPGGSTGRTLLADPGGTGAAPAINPATHLWDGTHPNRLGGQTIANSIVAVLDPIMDDATFDDLLNTRTANGEFGADIYTLNEYNFAGVGGTKAGTIAPTGDYADGKRITNNLPSTGAVACSKSGNSQIVTVSGTPSAAATIVQDEASAPTSTVTLGISSAVIGKFYELIGRRQFDDGAGGAADVRSYAVAVSLFGQWNVASSASGANSDYDVPLDFIFRTAPRAVYQTNPGLIAGNLSVNPAHTTRLSAVPQNSRMVLERQMLREVERTAYAAPKRIENYTTGANDRLRIIGVAGGVNALIAGPGQYSGGGLTYDPRWYLDGVQVAAGWTYTQANPTSGQVIAFRPRPSNSFGNANADEVTLVIP